MWHRLFRKAAYLGPRGLPPPWSAASTSPSGTSRARSPGRPIYDLLGGKVRDSVPLYANGWFAALDGHPACTTPEEYARRRPARRRCAATPPQLDPFLEMIPYHTGYLAGRSPPAGEQFGVDVRRRDARGGRPGSRS